MNELLGTFEQIVLLSVVRLADAAYGRSILREIEKAVSPGRSVAAGAVYATLDRLETKQYLNSRLEEGTEDRAGRARRYYRITAEGASALTETRRALESLWQGRPYPLEA
jgi:DNA-binding PadR family transcriptional regulator